MYKRILVPTDGSPLSEHAVDAAIEFARAFGSEIVALSVAVPEPVLQSLDGAMVLDPGQQVDALLEHAYTAVAAVAARVSHRRRWRPAVFEVDDLSAPAVLKLH